MRFKKEWEKACRQGDLSDAFVESMARIACPNWNLRDAFVIDDGCANMHIKVHFEHVKTPFVFRVYRRDPKTAYKEQKLARILRGKIPVAEVYQVAQTSGITFALLEHKPGILLREQLLARKANLKDIMFKVGRMLSSIGKIQFAQSGFFDAQLRVVTPFSRGDFLAFFFDLLKSEKIKKFFSEDKRRHIRDLVKMYGYVSLREEHNHLVHGDFDPSNILVTEVKGELEISAILDWEFAFSGSPLTDIANMLRYAHEMPPAYQDFFLQGVTSLGYRLPDDWQTKMQMLNLCALLDCLQRSLPDKEPNRVRDLQELIDFFVFQLKKIRVISYDPNWPKQFQKEAKRIKAALGESFVAVYHVGSTAVPGLAAKPKIDVVAEVKTLRFEQQPLLAMGYEYRGGFHLPFRKSFTYRSENLNVNLHVFEKNDPDVEMNLLFRDYLKSHNEARKSYERCKYALIQKEDAHQKNRSIYVGYTLGKHAWIQEILKKAGFCRLRVVFCAHDQEWESAKAYRNAYFFTPHQVQDPYTWTFTHKEHRHFCLYKGVDIVGYAHLQLWPEQRAAIRIIAIDERKRGQGFGKELICFIEKWLTLEGYRSVHVESAPSFVGFYDRIGYLRMPFNDPDGGEKSLQDVSLGKILS